MSGTAPVARYRYTLTITGNTVEEVEAELVAQVNGRGGLLLDSDYGQRDVWNIIGGRRTSRMEQPNPDMTPERYEAELEAWWQERKAAK